MAGRDSFITHPATVSKIQPANQFLRVNPKLGD